MKIYLDLVFLLNFFFDLLLLATLKIVLKRKVKWRRILCGGLVGGLSIFFLFLPFNSFTLFLGKILISIVMLGVSFGFTDKKTFWQNFFYLYFISILLGGFLYYLNLEFSYQNQGMIFFSNGFSINFLLLIFLSPIICYLYLKQDKTLKNIHHFSSQITIFYQGKKYTYQAYLDTGNKLYDPYFHRPIILLYDPKFPKIKKPIYIPYHTVEHSSLLEGFIADSIQLESGKMVLKPFIALSKNKFQIPNTQVLLHQDYLE